jgi:hypothetical protein
MRCRTLIIAAVTVFGLPHLADAQDPRDLSIRTFRLRNLRPEDAAKLLGPYVNSPGGGVFDAGSINAITVRETSSMLVLVDSLLRMHDRPRAIVTLRFQLIAALDSARRDPSIEGIDAELRKLFRFSGYELIGEGTTRSEEMTDFSTTLSTRPRRIGTESFSESFQIQGWIEAVEGTGDSRTVRMRITLQSGNAGREAPNLLHTGLTMPVGQSVILGSARPTMIVGSRGALILVVHPEVSESPRR